MWKKPTLSTSNYVNLVPEGDLVKILQTQEKNCIDMCSKLSKEQQLFAYAKGKWTISQVIMHIIDTERILAYRILRISRGDQTPLEGFDENLYVANGNVLERNFSDVLEEYSTVRQASVSLLKSLDESHLSKKGFVNGKEINLNDIAYMLAGHEIHHINVIKERYL